METDTARTLVRIYAVLAWVGALFALIGAFSLFFGGSFLGLGSYGVAGADGARTLGGVYILLGILLLAVAAFDVIVGYGLWTFRPWARIAAIVVSALNLLSFPIGTIIGAIGIWLFGFEPAIKALFSGRESRAAATVVAGKR